MRADAGAEAEAEAEADAEAEAEAEFAGEEEVEGSDLVSCAGRVVGGFKTAVAVSVPDAERWRRRPSSSAC